MKRLILLLCCWACQPLVPIVSEQKKISPPNTQQKPSAAQEHNTMAQGSIETVHIVSAYHEKIQNILQNIEEHLHRQSPVDEQNLINFIFGNTHEKALKVHFFELRKCDVLIFEDNQIGIVTEISQKGVFFVKVVQQKIQKQILDEPLRKQIRSVERIIY